MEKLATAPHNRRSELGEETSVRLAEMLRALGHPLRLRIVSLLCKKDRRVIELIQVLGAPQAIVSQQLRILRMSGLCL
jgi:DNA-binding transcriptional ArsR family regulator